MKHLPKYLQPRWRYLAVRLETWPDARLTRTQFQRNLWYSAQDLLGDARSADLDLTVVAFSHSEGTGSAIVRTRRTETEPARAALACLDEIDSDPVGVRVLGVSGTIRGCEEKYMGDAPEDPEQRHVVFDGAERSGSVRNGRVDVRTDDAFTGATILDCK